MAKMMTVGAPDDPAVLAAIAKVAIHHGHLDYGLRMMIKSLAGVHLQVAMDATEGETTGRLIEQVRALARWRFGELLRDGQRARGPDLRAARAYPVQFRASRQQICRLQ